VFQGVLYYYWGREVLKGRKLKDLAVEEQRQPRELLLSAQKALTQAWNLDPLEWDPLDYLAMIECHLHEGRTVLETWFNRSMAASPSNFRACVGKLIYLQPGHFGSQEEMMAFCQECQSNPKWRGKVPLILAEAHRRIAALQKEPKAYWSRPEVYGGLRQVFEAYLAKYPRSMEQRSRFAHFACLAGDWKTAHEQFTILGSYVWVRFFQTNDELENFRKKARDLGGLPDPEEKNFQPTRQKRSLPDF
jgi:hypothetical protein